MSPQTIESRVLSVDGLQIRYFQAGTSGAPLVLLHGGGVDSATITWGEALPMLAENHIVYAPDLPGYGASDKPDVTYTMDFYIRFLDHFLAALALPKVSLAGLSLGGGIALGFALDHPERVEKLVLVDSYGLQTRLPYHFLSTLFVRTWLNEYSYHLLRGSRSMARKSLEALVYDRAAITDDLFNEVYAMLKDPATGRAWTSFQRDECHWTRVRSDFTPRLAALRTPTLILHGDLDTAVPLKDAQRAQALIPGAHLVVLKNRRHWALRDRPEEIVQLMEAFLSAQPDVQNA
jgi:pimeloyl-ACP methyl ester carboxylesterase